MTEDDVVFRESKGDTVDWYPSKASKTEQLIILEHMMHLRELWKIMIKLTWRDQEVGMMVLEHPLVEWNSPFLVNQT